MQQCLRLGCALVRQQLFLLVSPPRTCVLPSEDCTAVQQLDSGSGAFRSAQWVAQQKPKLLASLFYEQLSGVLRNSATVVELAGGEYRLPM